MADSNRSDGNQEAIQPGSGTQDAIRAELAIRTGGASENLEGTIPVPQGGEAPPIRDVPPRWFAGMDGMLVLMLLALVFFLGAFQATNSDLYLNLAVGKRIAEMEWTPGEDPFLVTTEAREGRDASYWANPSWGGSFLFYILHTLVSPGGLVAFKALLLVGLAGCLLAIRPSGSSLPAAIFFVGLGMLAASPRFLLQTSVFSFFFLGLFLFILHRGGLMGGIAAARVRPGNLWCLPFLMVLWVNLDGWFVMGLLAVWLAWGGVGLSRLLGQESVVSGWKVGGVVLATTAACLASPHHVHVFVLPPELASLVLGWTESVGIPLPESLVAGGKTLRTLQQLDPTIASGTGLISPLSSAYWASTIPGYGGNLAGMAYVPLLVLSFLTFALVGFSSNQVGAPQPNGVRLLLWLVFGLMSMLQARLVPWFALVSAAILTLNMCDWLAWRRESNAFRVPDWRVGRLARLLLFLVLAIGLTLGWPGWLHSPSGDRYASRRVSLEVYEDESLRDLTRGVPEGARIFNMTSDVANYLAWFGPPGSRAFLDYRYQLFTEEAALWARVRRALLQENAVRVDWAMGAPGVGTVGTERKLWTEAFRKFGVTHVAATNFRRDRRTQVLTRGLWLDPAEWTMNFGDGMSVAFVWTKEGNGAGNTRDVVGEWPVRAFGEGARPVRSLAILPPGEVDPLEAFLHRQPPSPRQTGEAAMLFAYGQQMERVWQRFYGPAWYVGRWADTASGLLPVGLGITLTPTLAETLPPRVLQQPFPMPRSRRPFLHALDPAAPASPVLMVRNLRRGLQANPADGASYGLLSQAYRFLWINQEEYWANYSDLDAPNLRLFLNRPELVRLAEDYVVQEYPKANPLEQQAILLDLLRIHSEREQPQLRTLLRQVQIAHGIRSSLLQEPENPQLHLQMGSYLQDMNFLDLALDEFEQALKFWPIPGPDPAGQQAAQQRKLLQAEIERLESRLKKPRRDFQLGADRLEGLDRYRLAFRQIYRKVDPVTNRERYDLRGMGLAGEALQQLEKLKPESLGNPEKTEMVYWQLRLLLSAGRTKEVSSANLENLQPVLGPRFPEILLLYSGAVGDYAGVDAALVEMQKQVEGVALDQPLGASLSQGLGMSILPQVPILPRLVVAHMQHRTYNENARMLETPLRLGGEIRVLRGLNALEQGESAKAAMFFRQAVETTGPNVYCPDRRIAERYLALRNATRK